jgi:RNA polymerase sigma-70 factor, ECF subfamily
MPGSFALPLTQSDALQLHRRLLAHEPTASADLALAYLDHLIEFLGRIAPGTPQDLRCEAAEDALLALIRDPQSYCPEKQSLEVFLQISARGDLLNLLRKERKHQQGRIPWNVVEQCPDAGKYLGHEDDPSLGLRLAEDEQAARNALPKDLRQKLSGIDQAAIELILSGERKTRAFAELYGLLELPEKEQRQVVKRHKDRLKKILKREGRVP